ncbi:response regulator transcription factor [Pelagibius sp. Alg239-R121]|uniref:response regulator transcription factor n=1 Tax=Pelagibius sp. Alg239-R121 TaxID=2993448 RepID=UPI0024A74DDC|nr:response regulator transcription factor [Pelagibius sp. Alg239-R121]
MKILVVEDEVALSCQIQAELFRESFTVDLADNGEDGCFLGSTERYDAIVLDLGLPIKDGVTILREWRSEGVITPVLILTARGAWQDRVEGLNSGGDDYLAKPFQMEELVARLRALIRRSAGIATAELQFGPVSLNTESGRVYHQNRSIELTGNELKLLIAMMLRPNKVHSKSELAEKIYGYNEERDSNTVEVYIARLRQKIDRVFIRTIRGRGYTIGSAECPDL